VFDTFEEDAEEETGDDDTVNNADKYETGHEGFVGAL